MSYQLFKQWAHAENIGASRSASRIKYIVIHYTGNQGDTAENNADYYSREIVKASAHYFVDDKTVWQSVPDTKIAYAVGGTKYRYSKGGNMYGKVTNSNSISIELCGTGPERTASEATMENAAALTREIMQRYSIPLENVYRHYDVTGKECPAWAVDENVWARFKARLEDEMDWSKITAEDVAKIPEAAARALWARISAAQASIEVSPGLVTELTQAKAMGITDGSNPQGPCTRAQSAVMAMRAAKAVQK